MLRLMSFYIRWSDQIIVFKRTVIDPTNHRTST